MTTLRTTARTAMAAAIITDAGASAKLKGYNGARPAVLGAVTGGNTLLCTITFGATIGTAASGAVDFDEAGATQTNSAHVAGTPTFFDLTTSADVLVARVDVGAGADQWQFTGAVVNGQNVSLSGLALTTGNAT